MPPSPSGDRLTVAALPANRSTTFLLDPDADSRAALAHALGAASIRKLRFGGTLTPENRDGWRLDGQLGATVVQPCVVTLEPVTTRIDTDVTRRFVPPERFETAPASESEMPEDDTLEPLGAEIDLAGIMAEALALAMPAYPRAEGAEFGDAVHAEPGVRPMTDDDAKPFAGLAGLRDRLGGSGGDGGSGEDDGGSGGST